MVKILRVERTRKKKKKKERIESCKYNLEDTTIREQTQENLS